MLSFYGIAGLMPVLLLSLLLAAFPHASFALPSPRNLRLHEHKASDELQRNDYDRLHTFKQDQALDKRDYVTEWVTIYQTVYPGHSTKAATLSADSSSVPDHSAAETASVAKAVVTQAAGPDDLASVPSSQSSSQVETTASAAQVAGHEAFAAASAQSTAWPQSALARSSIIVPKVASTKILGVTTTDPEMQYIDLPSTDYEQTTLPSSDFQPGVQTSLTLDYPMFVKGSGSLTLNSTTEPMLKPLQWKPRFSRDNGKGGTLNGNKLFIFADTEIAGPETQWAGFVSNSVAVDKGNMAMSGKPLVLQDQMGAFSNSMGTLRNFVPFTTGESAYNSVMAGRGQRYAIWPQSSIMQLDQNTALLYAPIVYTDTHYESDVEQSLFNYVGTTLMTIEVPSAAGPVAHRFAPQIWGSADVEWGCIGGIRSFGSSGVDGGSVYVFGNHNGGLLLGRAAVGNLGNEASYEFWHQGGAWSRDMPTAGSSDTFLPGSFSNVDLFYSPRHLTFIIVFQNGYADNKFFWQYLKAPHPIVPSYNGGPAGDFVEYITKYEWSEAQLLLTTPVPPNGQYTYGGGVHAGYFDATDLARGGDSMLLTWTAPTGLASTSPQTGYELMSAVVTWE